VAGDRPKGSSGQGKAFPSKKTPPFNLPITTHSLKTTSFTNFISPLTYCCMFVSTKNHPSNTVKILKHKISPKNQTY
jgi:hypothetical protein